MTEEHNVYDEFEDQDCINCCIRFRVPKGFTDRRRGDKRDFYCPNGHPMAYTKSKADELAEQLSRERQQKAELVDRLRANEQSLSYWRQAEQNATKRATALKGQLTKTKKRVAHGVCPCCNRTFENLQRHMAAKHPTFIAEGASDGATAH